EITENINSAALYMDDAAGELKSFAAGSALESERRALSHLKIGDNQMQSFSDQLNSMPQNLSAGQSGIRTMPGGGAPGRSGYREGYVEIPGPGDAKSDKELREKILQALKEEHPEQYRELIREYFRRLAE
ncbi:MAG: hypothetical protein U9R36_05575, partial [Elusimicrobiota bacterium]|nr:hypothetical protein [Elusimicrobiota bacterium]